jgi:hypothetical protein
MQVPSRYTGIRILGWNSAETGFATYPGLRAATLDGDGVDDCREDDCRPEKKSPDGLCVARLIDGQWRDDPPNVAWCVDPNDYLPLRGPVEGVTPAH